MEPSMKKILQYIGIDVDDKAYNICVYNPLTDEFKQFKCGPSPELLIRSLKRHKLDPDQVAVCYEASYIGFSIQRSLSKRGYDCKITAPSLIPQQPGARQKTDRIDSIKLAKFYAKGLLTFIYIPDEEDEAVRDMLRSRRFLTTQQTKVKNHILAMCRRLGWNYKEETGMKTHWHKHHLQWLSAKINKTQIPAKKVSFKILLKQYEDVTKNIDLFDTEIMHVSQTPKYEKKVKALTSFKGVKENTALTIISELGDIRRFDHPKRIPSYAGFDIVEYSSGGHQKQYNISKQGNPFLRRAAVDAAKYALKSPAAGADVTKRRKETSVDIAKIASKCSARLYKKGSKMLYAGKPNKKIHVACAREFLGFVWETLNKVS